MTIYSGHITGDLILKKGDDASRVTSVCGSVDASENAQLDLSACTSVGGSVDARPGAQLDLSACTSVGGHDLPDPETARARLVAVAQAALASPEALVMDKWHNQSGGCGTAHCIAGWAVHLAGPEGYALEREVSQPAAGNVLLGLEASRLFFLDNDAARSAPHRVLNGEPALPGQTLQHEGK